MCEIESRLVKCFSAVLPDVEPAAIHGVSTDSVAAWDSVAMATLVAVVEEEFGISIAPEEIGRLTSFRAISDYVGRVLEPVVPPERKMPGCQS